MDEFQIQGIDPQQCTASELSRVLQDLSARIYDEPGGASEGDVVDFKDILVSAYHAGRLHIKENE